MLIRGIWLFGIDKNGELQLILSRRYESVEYRISRILGEFYTNLPVDKTIKDWFITEVLYEEIAPFTASRIPPIFQCDIANGVFKLKETERLNKSINDNLENVLNISHEELLFYMVKEDNKIIWPFIYSFRNGYFILICISLAESFSLNKTLLEDYKIYCKSLNINNNKFIMDFFEIRSCIQFLDDLFDILNLDKISGRITRTEILETWRLMFPFGRPIINKEYLQTLRVEDLSIPKNMINLLLEGNKSSINHMPYKINEDKIDEISKNSSNNIINIEYNNNNNLIIKNKQTNWIHGNIKLIKSFNNKNKINTISNIKNNIDGINDIIGISNIINFNKLSSINITKKSSDSINTNLYTSYSLKLEIFENICCFIKDHPLITKINPYYGYKYSDENIFENLSDNMKSQYTNFVLGKFEWYSTLPSSINISCEILLPWQKIYNYNNSNELQLQYKYIEPYILVNNNITCTKISTEFINNNGDIINSNQKNSNSCIINCQSCNIKPISRFKLQWNSNQYNNSTICYYWYPYQNKLPIKGYFSIYSETEKPIKQITQAHNHFKPILLHTFLFEYCLCFYPNIILGMEFCQISIPLLPSIIRNKNLYNIPNLTINSHTLKCTMGYLNISSDKKSILWTIDNPSEIIGSKLRNDDNSIIQTRLYGSITIRILYKSKTKNKDLNIIKNNNIISSYCMNIGINIGKPLYKEESLYIAPNSFDIGIHSLFNYSMQDIDPIWLLELHPRIIKFLKNLSKYPKRDIYSQLIDIIFSYSLITFSVINQDHTFNGIKIPHESITINPKVLQSEKINIITNAGKYIIWRNF
ncbi:uncharacterized protein CMU_002140 [Cryptosporidium muris RN66]|uniref:Uncharacterized protein n=1 Tax=Cryptosporidium muris (strain RN66) TaxID=441375 RepID=B6AGK2_CRYMR|nr:uncharacterized protein CMU_002140 [Cryptosporidium muris RN66]EEA07343.1 hypothetical protein, conserved [Cryptosporidium muris RN66]|eukprot:XP_002141692.1 hypothetical protein [Cryptosporidium muris RN66]